MYVFIYLSIWYMYRMFFWATAGLNDICDIFCFTTCQDLSSRPCDFRGFARAVVPSAHWGGMTPCIHTWMTVSTHRIRRSLCVARISFLATWLAGNCTFESVLCLFHECSATFLFALWFPDLWNILQSMDEIFLTVAARHGFIHQVF